MSKGIKKTDETLPNASVKNPKHQTRQFHWFVSALVLGINLLDICNDYVKAQKKFIYIASLGFSTNPGPFTAQLRTQVKNNYGLVHMGEYYVSFFNIRNYIDVHIFSDLYIDVFNKNMWTYVYMSKDCLNTSG